MANGFLDGLTSFIGTFLLLFYIKWVSTRLLRPVYHILPPGNSAARATLQKLSSFLTKRAKAAQLLYDMCPEGLPEKAFPRSGEGGAERWMRAQESNNLNFA